MVYLDNAASTALAQDVLAAFMVATGTFANPSSAHGPGAAAARALETARNEVAALVGGTAAEIVFTSGGTEANALGTLGVAAAARGRHVVVGGIEHPAVLRQCEQLGARGFAVTKVAPGPDGVVAVDALMAAVRSDTALVALMAVNNELGTIQPVAAVARALRAGESRAHLHCDAVQAVGVLPIDVRTLGADSVAISAHKMHGPKGAGALWLHPGARVQALWDGGRQERGLRSGTENMPALVAFGRAASSALAARADTKIAALRDALETSLFKLVPEAQPTVSTATPRAPHIISVRIPQLPAEPLLHALEARGVIASAGSACASRAKTQSHVLAAIGVPDDDAVLRFSLARDTDPATIAVVAPALRAAIDDVAPFALASSRRKNRSR